MKKVKKPKRKPRPARVQKRRTETIKEMIELATGIKPKQWDWCEGCSLTTVIEKAAEEFPKGIALGNVT